MKFIFAFLMVFFIGCATSFQYTDVGPSFSPKRTIPVWIDKGFGNQDQLSIEDAINQWNRVFNGQIRLEIVSTSFDMMPDELRDIYAKNGYVIMKVDSFCTFIPEQKPGQGTTLAWVDDIGTGHKMFIVRDRVITQQRMQGVTLHELGHLLGAEHLDDRSSLMHIEYSDQKAFCVDEASAKAVAKYQFLSYTSINHCFIVR